MMTENEIILKSIDLFNAVKENRIEDVKMNVEYFNNNFEPSVLIPALDGFFSFNEIFDKKTNESLFYVLNNLIYLDQKDKIKWDITIRELRKNGNNQKIENFINSLLNSTIEDWQFNSLITLCLSINRLDLLNQLMEKKNDKNY